MCRIISWANELDINQWKYWWWNKKEKRNGQTIKATCDRCEEGSDLKTYIKCKKWVNMGWLYERGDKKQRKVRRRYKERWPTYISSIEKSHITNDGMAMKVVI